MYSTNKQFPASRYNILHNVKNGEIVNLNGLFWKSHYLPKSTFDTYQPGIRPLATGACKAMSQKFRSSKKEKCLTLFFSISMPNANRFKFSIRQFKGLPNKIPVKMSYYDKNQLTFVNVMKWNLSENWYLAFFRLLWENLNFLVTIGKFEC